MKDDKVDWDSLADKIKSSGEMNKTITTRKPTDAEIALDRMMHFGQTQGIEPLYNPTYKRARKENDKQDKEYMENKNNQSTQSAIALRLMAHSTYGAYGQEKPKSDFLSFARDFAKMRKESGATDEFIKAMTPTQEEIDYYKQITGESEKPVSDDVIKSLDKTDESETKE